jgi:hypothetical protein
LMYGACSKMEVGLQGLEKVTSDMFFCYSGHKNIFSESA